MTDPEGSSPIGPLALAALLGVIAAAGAADLVLDRPEHWLTFHVGYEVLFIAVCLGGATWLWTSWRRAEHRGAVLRRDLAEQQAQRDAWRAEAEKALEGLAVAVARQFEAWQLTPAERSVALQLLKGASHREIAARTARSERTIRQQAAAVYRKAGVEGRAGLAGWFLEGLPLPGEGSIPGQPALSEASRPDPARG
jgi:DNA-binding CsgD family transcriptional regulator